LGHLTPFDEDLSPNLIDWIESDSVKNQCYSKMIKSLPTKNFQSIHQRQDKLAEAHPQVLAMISHKKIERKRTDKPIVML
jgi:hypothetical protein